MSFWTRITLIVVVPVCVALLVMLGDVFWSARTSRPSRGCSSACWPGWPWRTCWG